MACCELLNGLSFSRVLPFRGCFGQALFSPVFAYGFQKRCKRLHCVDLGESFPTIIYLQKSASIQPRTSPSKFGGKIFNIIHSCPCLGAMPDLDAARAGAAVVPGAWALREGSRARATPSSLASTQSSPINFRTIPHTTRFFPYRRERSLHIPSKLLQQRQPSKASPFFITANNERASFYSLPS